ncbi:MAG: TetR/AcrR family transcriptional regulator [Polyangiaceae bacterium]
MSGHRTELMPAVAKTTESEIVAAARRLVESRGRDAFSMNDVALAVGVRTPSLYGRFVDRGALVDAIELDLWLELGRRLAVDGGERSPVAKLTAQANAYRKFAKSNPEGYALLYRRDAGRSEAGTAARGAAVATSLGPLAALVGEKDALAAARVLTPFLHGFVSMELAGAFRLGGGLDEAFAHGVAAILKGLKGAPKRKTSSDAPKPKPVRSRSKR